jgi:hypothetical protein
VEVAGSNPAGREARDFQSKNTMTFDFNGAGGWLTGWGLPGLKIIFATFFGSNSIIFGNRFVGAALYLAAPTNLM